MRESAAAESAALRRELEAMQVELMQERNKTLNAEEPDFVPTSSCGQTSRRSSSSSSASSSSAASSSAATVNKLFGSGGGGGGGDCGAGAGAATLHHRIRLASVAAVSV